MKIKLLLLTFFVCSLSFAQTTVSGTVTDVSKQSIPGANINVEGSSNGASADFDGSFILETNAKPPFTIKVSAVGFQTKTYNITSNNQKFNVVLVEEQNLLNEIVVSASRTPERIVESPVTVERMGMKEIKSTTAPTFYDGLENLKEVHFNTSSISFKSINTRGFASVANTRFMQLVDGMDNSSPALNFVLGNLIGVSDLDVANVELLPGASSALYGANAFNGILFMNSKNPFTSEGVSAYAKYGQTTQVAAGSNNYVDVGVRVAKAVTNYFALKGNLTYVSATEWIADDKRSMTIGGNSHATNQNYDGLNIYGDEISTFIPNVGQVSRTGYQERDLNDNKVKNIKADISLHFRPWGDDGAEIIFQEKLGLGTTIYQGANRYSLNNFRMSQTKLEVQGKNFFARVYNTSEDAGDSYDMRFAGWNVNRAAKSDTEWFTNYATAYQLSGAVMGTNANESAAIGRTFADYNTLPAAISFIPAPAGSARFEPGSAAFNTALQNVVDNPDLTQGAKFIDHSKLYHADVNYNFKDLIKFAEIQVGGSWRQYVMNSEGTIFTDYDGELKYKEYGAYAQLQKKWLEDRLKFTGSIRYDKSQNFDGNVSPRVSFVYSAGNAKQHNFRVSYQTGFRNPTTQDQYIGLDLGPFALIGSAPENLDRFVETKNVSAASQALGAPATVTLSGQDAYKNAYTLASVTAFGATSNPNVLEVANIGLVKPEEVQAFEVGYRSVVNNDLSIDINAYYNMYTNFMNTSRVISPYYGKVGTDSADPNVQQTYAALKFGDRRVYQVYTNTSAEINSFGYGIGLSKKIYKDFELGANYNYAEFEFDQTQDPSFVAGFNTPKHRIKASLGNSKVTDDLGFNVSVRWNSEYLWESSFGDGIIPENTVLDVQVNYAFTKLKSVLKVGATNLFGEDYLQVVGAGLIGQQWFAAWTLEL
ncbi:carboxypeptidase-like regulatory domain-containing protein [Flavobacterium sp. TAB 87]|uniref:TonB-dependent receptor n=1 Tax=Flavobacterium sp. TAB 87 TaxID=1729581 RepID=UPI00076CF965|nr:carboxypeptidase-like regulatory domain-containing protein [Flavobacterium sp. TAB 87]KVV13372.1 enterobactin receptor protein [Flavobacterium sp. TAB 87]